MRLYLFILILIFSACQSQVRQEVDLYFDLEQKVNETVLLLASRNIELVKTAEMQGISDTVTLVPDSASWSTELDLFRSANINRIQNQDLYNVREENDQNSNLKIKTYVHDNPEEAKVPVLELRYLDDESDPRSVYAEFRENNAGFVAHRNLIMEFDQVLGENLLKSYRINGFQKILGQDTVKFMIRGELKY